MTKILPSQSSEHALRLLIENVKDYGIFIINPVGTIMTWNGGASRIIGYNEHEVLGRNFSMFYTKDDQDRAYPRLELERASELGRLEEEGWRVRKDGTKFWANVIITRLDDARGNCIGFGKVTRDLTERKKIEEQIRATNESLERRVQERTLELRQTNEKLREAIHTRDEFLTIASHELRTPIMPLKMHMQTLSRGLRRGTFNLEDRERLIKMSESIDRSLGRLSHLIDNLLDVARIHAGKITLRPEPFDAAEAVRDICRRFHAQAHSVGCDVALEVPEEPPVNMDPFRFEQIAVNLFTNAIKYGAGKPIFVSLKRSPAALVFAVKDHGIGIASENFSRIFERFERAIGSASRVGGLGLGLYIVKQIVDAQHGHIDVESKEGAGSTFRVELPLQ